MTLIFDNLSEKLSVMGLANHLIGYKNLSNILVDL